MTITHSIITTFKLNLNIEISSQMIIIYTKRTQLLQLHN